MRAKNDKTNLPDRQGGLLRQKKGNMENNNLPGYPIYPDDEDIYSKYQEEKDVNPEDITKTKGSDFSDEKNAKKDSGDDISGSNLDVPGAELDDSQENIGSEDEENNYYSLGGDEHNELEEDKGD